jgi:type II secretory pathway pseudopilin PulG
MSQSLTKHHGPMHGGFRRRLWRGFVLLEVILSLTILGFSVAAFMRSFNQSLQAARRMEIQTQAMFFAQQLLDYFEINPPKEGLSEGGFGEDYKYYFYEVDLSYENPEYDWKFDTDGVEQFFALRPYKIRIIYNDGMHKPYVAFTAESSIVGFEKFERASKAAYMNY